MRRFFPMQRSERGYTLVEILTVIVIIGILTAIAVPIYLNQKNKATAATVQSDLNNAAIVLEQLRAQNDGDYIYNDYWDKRAPSDPNYEVPSNTNLILRSTGPSVGTVKPDTTTAAQQAKGITRESRIEMLKEVKVSPNVVVYIPRANKGTCIAGYVSGVSGTTYHYDLIKRRLDEGACPPPVNTPPDQPDPGATAMVLSGTGTETISLSAMAVNRSGSLTAAGGSPSYKFVIKNPGAQVSSTRSRLILNDSTGLSDNGYIELTSDGKWSISNVNRLGSIVVQIEVTDRFGEKITGSKRFVATPAGSNLATPTLTVTPNAAGGGDVTFSSVDHATQYRIEYSTESAVTGWQTALTYDNIVEGVSSYETVLGVDMMPEPGNIYHYRVRAEAPSGGSAPGAWSEVVSVEGATLEAPSLTATKLGMDSSGQQVRLDWARVPNAHSTYYLYIDGARSGTKIEPGHTLIAPFERNITYAVAATSPSGNVEGPKSNTVTVNTVWETPILNAVEVKNGSAQTTLRWNKPASNWGASNMVIQLSPSSTFANNVVTINAPASATSHTLTGMVGQGTYYARVRVTATGGVQKNSANRSFSTSNFCADLNASSAGWTNAVANQNSSHEARRSSVHNATPIWRWVGGDIPGPLHFRKVFYVPEATSVTFTALADNEAQIQLNGASLLNVTAWGNPAVYTTRSLPAGCHTITARVTNHDDLQWHKASNGIHPSNPAGLMMSVRDAAGNNLTLTDTTWKMWSPGGAHYSTSDYYYDVHANVWGNARDMGQVGSTGTPWGGNPGNWAAAGGDGIARYIASPWGFNIAGTHSPTWNYPVGWQHFRSGALVGNWPNARLVIACDDQAHIYVNGAHIATCNGSGSAQTFNFAMPGPTNYVGISVYNGGVNANPTMFVASLYGSGSGLLRRSDQWWLVTRSTPSAPNQVRSFHTGKTPPNVSNDY